MILLFVLLEMLIASALGLHEREHLVRVQVDEFSNVKMEPQESISQEAEEDSTSASTENGNQIIDFVYCWSGEEMQKDIEQLDSFHDSELVAKDTDALHLGFGFNEIKVSIRSLQKFAPWFNKAYLLVNGPARPPYWAVHDPRIEMVDRCTLFPNASDCPTFNTFACEAVAHLIPGLSERFIYLDDDLFLTRSVQPSNFFSANGKPITSFDVKTNDLVEIYGSRASLPPGPNMPPELVPMRMTAYPQQLTPMLVSFAKLLETKFTHWYAFVRSHKTRFTCCDASTKTGGTEACDEDILRVYPAMMHLNHINDELSTSTHSNCTHCDHVECIAQCLLNPKVFVVNANNMDAPNWRVVRDLMMHRFGDVDPVIPVTLHKWHSSSLSAVPLAALALLIGLCWQSGVQTVATMKYVWPGWEALARPWVTRDTSSRDTSRHH